MTKKEFKDYTPEQQWKLERRLTLKWYKENPDKGAKLDGEINNFFQSTLKARQEALKHIDAQDNWGASEYKEYCINNPLSSTAQIHLRLIEQEKAEPALTMLKKIKDNPKHREDGIHKAEFQGLVSKLEHSFDALTDLKTDEDLKFYFINYEQRTLSQWVKEVFPDKLKRGRPRIIK